MICLDKTTTGDGLMTALQVLAIMKQDGHAAVGTYRREMPQYPQTMLNVRTAKRVDPNR